MSNPIYEPKGKAREYSPLALNIYNGCDHQCTYCYLKHMPSKLLSQPNPEPKKDLLMKLTRQLNREVIDKQILLCFSGDPYCYKETELGITRKVLELLLEYQVPVAILTKGGHRCLRDMDLFQQFKRIKIGVSLTYDDDYDTVIEEPGAACVSSRIMVLQRMSQNGISTFVSLEPVVSPTIALELFRLSVNWVDHYLIGKMNYTDHKDYSDMDYEIMIRKMIGFIAKKRVPHEVKIYIKDSLKQYISGQCIHRIVRNSDELAV